MHLDCKSISKKLDIEFTELVTGYRLRTGNESAYIDIYLYDSLSSGAGYAVSIADVMSEILMETKNQLKSCDCESACSKCLKHYRNQHIHGLLDRFAGLQLLEWGVNENVAPKIPLDEQIKMISPLKNILEQSGCKLDINDGIIAIGKRGRKKITIYPSMWREPCDSNTIFSSLQLLRHNKIT